MVALHPEFVIDGKSKKKSVLVTFREWKRIIEALEELDDIVAYDEAKKEKSAFIPFTIKKSRSLGLKKK